MKLISQIYLSSLIFSLGSIIGISIWANSNDVFTLSSSYSFYWFVALTSFLVSLQLYCSHTVQFMINYTRSNMPLLTLHSYVIPVFGGIYTIFWLGAAAGVASDLKSCLYIKRNYIPTRFNRFDDDYNCNGEIVSTVFGFANFVVWCTIIYYGGCHWFSVYQKSQNQELVTSPETQNDETVIPNVPEKTESTSEITSEIPDKINQETIEMSTINVQ